MNLRTVRSAAAAAAAAALLASCAPRPAPPAPVPPAPRPRPPAPSPPEPPPAADWRDGPLSPGDWRYRREDQVSLAAFGSAQGTAFVIRCEAGDAISLARLGAAAPAMVVRTSFGARRLPAPPAPAGETVVTLAPSDPLLDQMVFSRGRFLIEVDGAPTLILPAWPEPARVIEDCRG